MVTFYMDFSLSCNFVLISCFILSFIAYYCFSTANIQIILYIAIKIFIGARWPQWNKDNAREKEHPFHLGNCRIFLCDGTHDDQINGVSRNAGYR